jgi:ankyrin repeat protein
LKDANGRTPLLCAAQSRAEAVVQRLLMQSDIEADSTDLGGRTPLSYAAENRSEPVVQQLLERQDVNADSKDT